MTIDGSAASGRKRAGVGRRKAKDGFRWSEEILDRDEQHRLRRRKLLQTAAQAFNETSFHTTTVEDLAQRLNVTKPALYYYIKDKDDILFECQLIAFELMRDALDSSQDAGLNGLERLLRFLRSYVDMMTNDFGICLVRTGLRPLKSESRAKLKIFAKQLDVRMRTIISDGVADGSIRRCDPKLVSYAIFGGFNGIAYWYQSDGSFAPQDIAAHFIDLFVKGLEPDAAPPSKSY